jgi:DNA-binding HxlR family transcriptional regulator
MLSRCKLLGLLTPHQVGTLKTLLELNSKTPGAAWRPREIGAYKSSHHSRTLQSLEERGLVRKEELCRRARPQYGYSISSAGMELWASFKELAQVPAETVMGRRPDQQRAAQARWLARTA